MPYEILEVELTGNTSKLDKVLADVDARLAKMASGTYKVAVGAGSSGVNAINAATTATNKLTDSQMRYKREVQDATATATKNYRQLDQALSKIANSKYADKLTGLNNEIRSGSLKGAEALQKVNSEIRQLGAESNKSDGFLKKVWSTIKQFGTAYLVIQGLRTGFNALTDATLHYNEILENAQIGLTNLLGGSKALAKNLLDQLQQFAIVTPFQFSDLVPYVAQLKAVGFAYKDILPTIKAVGEASAGTGLGNDGMQRIIYALGQIRAEGKLTGRVMHELQQAEIPATRYLAEAFGVTTGKVKELVREGLIPADAAIKAITAGINKTPSQGGFAGSLEAQSKTFLGTLSNIGDALKKVLGGATENAFNGLTKLASKFQTFVSSDEFEAWTKVAVVGLTGVLHYVEDIYNFTVDHWPEVKLVLGGMAVAWGVVKLRASEAAFAQSAAALAAGRGGLGGILGGAASFISSKIPAASVSSGVLTQVGSDGLVIGAETAGLTAGLTAMLPAIGAVIVAMGLLYGVYRIYANQTDKIYDANLKLAKNINDTSKKLSESADFAGNDDALTAKIANINKAISDAGDDATKFKGILADIQQIRTEVKFDPKLGKSAKLLIDHDLGASADNIIQKPYEIALKMSAESQGAIASFFDSLRFWDQPNKPGEISTYSLGTVFDKFRPMFNVATGGFLGGLLGDPTQLGNDELPKRPKAAELSQGPYVFNSPGYWKQVKGDAEWDRDHPTISKLDDANGKAATKLEKDRLSDAAKLYNELGKAAEDSAKRQIDALKKINDSVKDLFGGFQEGLAKYGILNSPLDSMIAKFQKLLNIGPQAVAAANAGLAKSGAFYTHALHANMARDKMTGGDGLEPAESIKIPSLKAPRAYLMPNNGVPGVPELTPYSVSKLKAEAAVSKSLLKTVGKSAIPGLAENQGGDVDQAIMSVLGGLSLSKFGTIPKEFGKSVDDSEAHAARFKAQMFLANQEVQQGFLVKYGPAAFAKIAKGIAKIADETDRGMNFGRFRIQLRDTNRANLAIGKENDPIFNFRQSLLPGGSRDGMDSDQQKIALGHVLTGVNKEARLELDKFVQSKRNEKQALSEAAPFMRGQTADLFAYNRQLAITKERQSYAQSDGMLKLWHTNPAAFNKNLRTHMTAFTSGMDTDAGAARGNDYVEANKALDARGDRLQRQLSTVRDSTLSEQDMNDALDKQAYYYGEIDRLVGLGTLPKRARELAAALSLSDAYNKSLERQVSLETQNRQANDAAKTSLDLNAEMRGIYNSTISGSAEQQRQIETAQMWSAITADAKKGIYEGRDGAQRMTDRITRESGAISDNAQTDATKDAGALKLTQFNSLLDQNLAINTKRLDNMYQLSDVQKQQLEFDNENTKDMLAMKDVTPDIIDFQDKYIENLKTLQNLQRQAKINADNDALAAYGVPSGRQRDKFLRDQATMHDANLSGKDKGDQINREDILAQAQQADQALQEVASSLSGAWSSSMGTILSSTDSTFRKITDLAGSLVQDVGNYFEKLAEQYLANQAIGFLLKSTGLDKILGALQGAVSQGVPTQGSSVLTGTSVFGGDSGFIPAPSAGMRATTIVNIHHSGDIVTPDPETYQRKMTAMANKNASIDSERTRSQTGADIVNFGNKNR